MSMHFAPDEPVKVQLTLTLQPAVLDQVEQLRLEWGLNTRAAVIERLLVEVLKLESRRDS